MTQTIDLDDFLSNQILTNLKIHPSETFGLYFVNTLNYEKNVYDKRVFLIDLADYTTRLIPLEKSPQDYYFKDEFILFKYLYEDSTVFYAYHPEKGQLKKVCEIPFLAESVGCGDKLYFTAPIKADKEDVSMECSSRSPFYIEGRGVVGKTITGLFSSDYEGRKIQVITDLEMDINLIDYDFKSSQIVMTAFKSSRQKPISSSVFTYDIKTEQMQMFTRGQYRIDAIKSINPETLYFMGVDLDRNNRNDNQQVHRINLSSGEVMGHGDFVDMSNERPVVVTDCLFTKGPGDYKTKDRYYFLRVGEDRQLVASIDTSGQTEHIDTGLRAISNFAVIRDRVILLGLKDEGLSEIYCYRNRELTRITRHNDWLKAYSVSKPQALEVKVDGILIKGWVCPPHKTEYSEKDQKKPAVLMIHGGPKMIYSDVFSFDIQLLSAKGYYVLYANPMGSDGRGNAFADIRGNFCDLPYKQLMAFVDKALQIYPDIDNMRMGVTGGSYGGYMTNHIITKTDRFRAAVSERGISNMLTALTSSDIGYKFAVEYSACRCNPWKSTKSFVDISPIMNVQYVKTPTLFNHGKDDFRCHYTESLNMYSALSQLGVETRLCLYEGENHGLVTCGRPRSKRKRYEELSSWFDKYLK